MREAKIERKTAETNIKLTLNLDGSGKSDTATGCGFLDHMLTLFARHGRFDLFVNCKGDTEVDYHHTAEDIGIALGQAFSEALGEKRGICRYGTVTLPMDEALITASLDISGRSCLCYGLQMPTPRVGDFDTELCEEFWQAFVRNSNITLHLIQNAGKISHHIIEGAFKATARALACAVKLDEDFPNDIPSTKGVL